MKQSKRCTMYLNLKVQMTLDTKTSIRTMSIIPNIGNFNAQILAYGTALCKDIMYDNKSAGAQFLKGESM